MPRERQQMTSFLETLRTRREQTQALSADSWLLRLERVRGKIGGDGVERISTQELFDVLEVAQKKRTAGACRRLARLMRELGWTAMKVRAFDQRGFRDKVRGWARDARGTG
jgi:hypothetical protein